MGLYTGYRSRRFWVPSGLYIRVSGVWGVRVQRLGGGGRVWDLKVVDFLT